MENRAHRLIPTLRVRANPHNPEQFPVHTDSVQKNLCACTVKFNQRFNPTLTLQLCLIYPNFSKFLV